MRRITIIATSLLAFGGALSVPAASQTLEDLDALSDITADEQSGIAAARQQASRGEYLEALATLERVLAAFPKSRDGLLIHALYLCEIDDRRGGMLEIEQLKERDYGRELLGQAKEQCRNAGRRPS